MGFYALTQDRIIGRRQAVEFANSSKGIPIPGTGCRNCRCYFCAQNSSRNSGVMGNSKILSHRYAGEGERGPVFRREIRRKENVMWRNEALSEMQEELYEMMCEPDF